MQSFRTIANLTFMKAAIQYSRLSQHFKTCRYCSDNRLTDTCVRNKKPDSPSPGNGESDIGGITVADSPKETQPEPPVNDGNIMDKKDDYWEKWKSYNDWNRSQSKHRFQPRINPAETSVFLFPGQGSQFVGMGKQLLEFANVKEMYEIASSILGYDLLKICLEGPKATLDKTVYQQPAILVTSLAAVESLRFIQPEAIEFCVGAAGFSIGEYAALVFSGAITFEDAVRVVKVRAEAMQKDSEAVPSGMMMAFLNPNAKLKLACQSARRFCQTRRDIENPVCGVANYLFPEGKVLAGHSEALKFIENNTKEFGIKRTRYLPVSGAFHTKLMYNASRAVEAELKNIEITEPIIPVYSNVNSYKYRQTKIIRHLLAEQVFSPVKWEQIMHVLYSRPKGEHFPQSYEVGPGQQLGGLLKQTNAQAHARYNKISV